MSDNNQTLVNDFLKQLNINTNVSSKPKKNKKKTSTKESKEVKEAKQDKKPISTMGKLALLHKQKIKEEEERIAKEKEEEERKIREEEERIEQEKQKLLEIARLKKEKIKNKIQAQKDAGLYKTQSQKEKDKLNKIKLDKILNIKPQIETKAEIIQKEEITFNPEYKTIISGVFGHVDTGKTTLLDKIRNSSVQKGEVGGITQQIGATFIPKSTLLNKTNCKVQSLIEVPGMLMIDTPGHEAFVNLRKIGSSICDIGILVIDLVHGLENQTYESITILKETNTPFVIGLNKIDRLYGWVTYLDMDFESSLKLQSSSTQDEFKSRVSKIKVQLMEQGLNVKLFYELDNFVLDLSDKFTEGNIVSICPISAITGEGIPELLLNVITWTQKNLSKQITWTPNLKCMLMETTVVEGFGTTLDVIVIDGQLNVGDNINVHTSNGIINTQIKTILTIQPNKELRIKTDYLSCVSVKASQGVKVVLNNFEHIGISGSYITLSEQKQEDDLLKAEQPSNNFINLQESGVMIFASSVGSLKALVNFLQTECEPPIPIFDTGLGTVLKKHVKKFAISSEKSKQEYKVILAFNVKVDEEAEQEAKNFNIKIFTAEIIYNLFDLYKKYINEITEKLKLETKDKVMFPCELKILSNCIFNKKNPMVFGVEVQEGNLHLGTEISNASGLYIGKVIGIQNNKLDVSIGKKGSQVCIKIENSLNETLTYGRTFDDKQMLYSKLTRESIDILKQFYRKECTKDDLLLIVKIKKILNIE